MSSQQLLIDNLVAGGWRDQTFEPFVEGVEICRLVEGEPALALLRYAPGAKVRAHKHVGLETILVLEGSQCDENGCYEAGALVVNPVGTSHSVWSETGCVILIHWERPVEFLGAST